MTGFNNNGKFVPSTPKTYEVKYVENKQSGLSPAARNKVINRSSSNYLSESKDYGPCITKNCRHPNKKFNIIIVLGEKSSVVPNISLKRVEIWNGPRNGPTGSDGKAKEVYNIKDAGKEADDILNKRGDWKKSEVNCTDADRRKLCDNISWAIQCHRDNGQEFDRVIITSSQ